jgi:hypothetical protein
MHLRTILKVQADNQAPVAYVVEPCIKNEPAFVTENEEEQLEEELNLQLKNCKYVGG